MFSGFFGGFDANKCKTSLRLCVNRIKLLQNKKTLAIKTFRKEIAGLLSSGKEDSARIRVEALMQEQATVIAYEILELYCELMSVRVELMKHTKGIPEDMHETISSVLYAAKRCSAQLPELTNVRDQMVYKYGKEYVARSQSEDTCKYEKVNPRLIDSLSIRAPLAEEKLELLSDIAQEFGIEWNIHESAEAVQLESDNSLGVPNPMYPNVQFGDMTDQEVLDDPSKETVYGYPAQVTEQGTASSSSPKKVVDNTASAPAMHEFQSADEAAAAAMKAAEEAASAAEAAAMHAKKKNEEMHEKGASEDNGEQPEKDTPVKTITDDQSPPAMDKAPEKPNPTNQSSTVTNGNDMDELTMRFEALKNKQLPKPPKHL